MAGPMAMAMAGAQEHWDFLSKMRGEVARGQPMRTRDAEGLLEVHGGSVLNTARAMRAEPKAFISMMSESGAIEQDHPLARAAAQKENVSADPRPMRDIMGDAGLSISDRNSGMIDRMRWLAFDRAIRKGAPINGEAAVSFLERSASRAEKHGDVDEATRVAGLALEADQSWTQERQASRLARREDRAGEAR